MGFISIILVVQDGNDPEMFMTCAVARMMDRSVPGDRGEKYSCQLGDPGRIGNIYNMKR